MPKQEMRLSDAFKLAGPKTYGPEPPRYSENVEDRRGQPVPTEYLDPDKPGYIKSQKRLDAEFPVSALDWNTYLMKGSAKSAVRPLSDMLFGESPLIGSVEDRIAAGPSEGPLGIEEYISQAPQHLPNVPSVQFERELMPPMPPPMWALRR